MNILDLEWHISCMWG